jgi:hypothetical protein
VIGTYFNTINFDGIYFINLTENGATVLKARIIASSIK